MVFPIKPNSTTKREEYVSAIVQSQNLFSLFETRVGNSTSTTMKDSVGNSTSTTMKDSDLR